jgi:hypothetical protein
MKGAPKTGAETTGERERKEQEGDGVAWMREKAKDPNAARPERFPALALSRSGSKGISHPRHTDNPASRLRCAAQDPRVNSRNDTPRCINLATFCNAHGSPINAYCIMTTTAFSTPFCTVSDMLSCLARLAAPFERHASFSSEFALMSAAAPFAARAG